MSFHLQTGATTFDFEAPHAHAYNLADAVSALSKVCRFGGWTTEFYSVAQHCVLVSHIVPVQFAREALFHDIAEAYTGDFVSPLKRLLKHYSLDIARILGAIEDAICRRYDLPLEMSPEVHHADLVALATERRDLLPRAPDGGLWGALPRPHGDLICALPPTQAEKAWWDRYEEIMYGDEASDHIFSGPTLQDLRESYDSLER